MLTDKQKDSISEYIKETAKIRIKLRSELMHKELYNKYKKLYPSFIILSLDKNKDGSGDSIYVAIQL